MKRVQGPECPKCGCCAGTKLQTTYRWGVKYILYRCDYCAREHRARVEGAVDASQSIDGVVLYPNARCPECGSTDVPVASTPANHVRWHKCRTCGGTFKSVERTG